METCFFSKGSIEMLTMLILQEGDECTAGGTLLGIGKQKVLPVNDKRVNVSFYTVAYTASRYYLQNLAA